MTDIQSIDKPVFMRDVWTPQLPAPLESAAAEWIFQSANGPGSPLSDMRAAAFSTLKNIGLPHSGSEEFTFLRVGELLPHFGPTTDKADTGLTLPSLAEIQSLIFPECLESYVVLVDGIYVPSLSHIGPNFKIKAWNGEHWVALSKVLADETDAAAALAMLFSRAPVFIEIAPKATPLSPLQILHYYTRASSEVISPVEGKSGSRTDSFTVIAAGMLSEGRILVRHFQAAKAADQAATASNQTSDALINVHTVLLLEEGARLHFLDTGIESQTSAIAAGQAEGFHFRKLTARLERNSHVLAVSAHTGARLMRNSFAIDLEGEGADAEVNGATVLTGRNQSHNFLRVRHLVPHCTSRQHFKSVVAGTSRCSVDGTIFVAQDAQGTNANQLINNLMLSDEARTDSKPQLMIHADDVKCTHGTTIGKLDPAQQFYLESRGLTVAQARTLMTVAFIAEILNKTSPGSFRTLLDRALIDTLKLHLPSIAGESSKIHA